jgi:hypothetical protein
LSVALRMNLARVRCATNPIRADPSESASRPSGEHHGTTASSSNWSAKPISNPAHPENTVNVPVGTPVPRSQMVSGPFCR